MTYNNGDYYKGHFNNGLKEGHGELYTNEFKYIGE